MPDFPEFITDKILLLIAIRLKSLLLQFINYNVNTKLLIHTIHLTFVSLLSKNAKQIRRYYKDLFSLKCI